MTKTFATLDVTKNNCCWFITDGDELKNRIVFSVVHSSVAVVFCAIKGKPLKRWLAYYLRLRI